MATHDLNDTTRSRTMAYDGLDRLIEAQSAIFGGDGIHRFEYDAVDNLMAWTLGGVKDYARYVYGADNRLAQIQGTGGGTLHTFSHDVQGNVTAKDSAVYHFDVGNRLRAVVAPTVTETYRYDGHGRRVLAWTTAGTKLSMYSATGQVIYQQLFPADQNKAIDYVYLSGSLVANREIPLGGGTAVVKYQHTDALGSPVAVTDSTGAVVERTNYDPYGGVIGGPKDGVGYTGHVMDARTGLHYMQQRYYDPRIGAFLSVDPVAIDTATGWNACRYCYAANNPYKFKDPDGRIIDTVVDVGFLVYDVYKIATEGATSENMAALGADAAGLFIPGATGLGLGVRAAGHGADALKAADNVADAARAARPADGVSMGTDEALDTAPSYLGDGYKQIDSGVYRSADGTRQVRMTDRDLNHPRQEPQMNFEEGQTVPNQRGTSTFEAEHNSHVYLPEEKR